MRAFIFGAGGHAAAIASVLETDVTFVVSDDLAQPGQMLASDFFSRIDDFRKAAVYIGIGSNAARREIYDKLTRFDVRAANCISRHSFVARNAELGSAVAILPGSVVGARARIHDNVIVNTLSSVDHDCVLGSHSQVTAGVTFGGMVRTGENCFFGIKCGVVPNVVIGNNVAVMAGALVVRDLPDDVTAGGSPARIIKKAGTRARPDVINGGPFLV
jgi:sugar O-acyltransferase (sialic acid O-acetyltransferase NeuD family)